MKIIDLHCDTICRLEENDSGETLAANNFHVDLDKLSRGGYLLQTFALFVDRGKYPDTYRQFRRLLDCFRREMEANSHRIAPVASYSQLLENERQGKLSALLSLEEGDVCAPDIDRIGEIYNMGVRMMTLTWNYENPLARPNHLPGYEKGCRKMAPEKERGLTEKGILFVEELERLSMMLDLSHLGDKGIEDVLAHTKGPVLASHSNARALCGHVRNLTDQMIRRIAERGGVIGVNFYPRFLKDRGRKSTVERIIAHIRHFYQTGGLGCIALGTDFDGMNGNLEILDASFMQLLDDGLKRAGFTRYQRERICFGNARDFLKEWLPA